MTRRVVKTFELEEAPNGNGTYCITLSHRESGERRTIFGKTREEAHRKLNEAGFVFLPVLDNP